MEKKTKYYLWGGAALLLLLAGTGVAMNWAKITDWLIPEFEGFRASPYWDNQQYSWGYGTRAPGPGGTITREQALDEMRAYLQADYQYYQDKITVPMNGNKWAAFLSFAYNLGRGNANELADYINAQDEQELFYQWGRYVYAGGSRNADLVARRAKELEIWQGQV